MMILFHTTKKGVHSIGAKLRRGNHFEVGAVDGVSVV